MMNIGQVRVFVVRPALKQIGLWSEAAEELVMGTAMQESGFVHVRQLARRDGRRGPARGLFQMEPATHRSLWRHFLAYRKSLGKRVLELSVLNKPIPSVDELIFNLSYAAAMCRVKYYRIREPLPNAGDIREMARQYKRYYNTPAGAGTESAFKTNYRRMLMAEKRTPI